MTETVAYEEVGRIGDVELRRYPKLLLATVTGYGDGGFSLLFNYISGANRPREKIPMTAPVITSEKIPMTTPVVSEGGSISFVLPERYLEQAPPEPEDRQIKLQEVPARDVAVIRFRGYADDATVKQMQAQLLSILQANGIRSLGEPFLMRYNAPITPGFMRRNEVGIAIERRDG
ncbi:MAG: SOUL heme-binding protein [Methanoculleus sp. SDB]|nr:MAG: SOUL heme-binding protein [Methanoculleus sp. SDB]